MGLLVRTHTNQTTTSDGSNHDARTSISTINSRIRNRLEELENANLGLKSALLGSQGQLAKAIGDIARLRTEMEELRKQQSS